MFYRNPTKRLCSFPTKIAVFALTLLSPSIVCFAEQTETEDPAPQLELSLSENEIVITSQAGATWRAVLSVNLDATRTRPGGGTMRSLHIPADNPESIVGTKPMHFGHSAWGLDNLEWRYVPKQGEPGIRKPIGTTAKIDQLTISRPSPNEIVVEMSGSWENVPKFTRRITFDPNGWRATVTADWDGPENHYGMWWMWSLFESDWIDNENVSIQDIDHGPVPLPVFRGNVRRVPEGIDFPYSITFPLSKGQVPSLNLTVNQFGALKGSKGGPFYELWPEEKARKATDENDTYKNFMPRWVGRGIPKQRYTFDYQWRIGSGPEK